VLELIFLTSRHVGTSHTWHDPRRASAAEFRVETACPFARSTMDTKKRKNKVVIQLTVFLVQVTQVSSGFAKGVFVSSYLNFRPITSKRILLFRSTK
jgi:hypothetical protein